MQVKKEMKHAVAIETLYRVLERPTSEPTPPPSDLQNY